MNGIALRYPGTMTSKINQAGIFAALLLVGLTVTVFARNQQTGPEGALTRFFSSIAANDAKGALAASGGQPTIEFTLVGNAVSNLFRAGASYQVLEIRRMGSQAFATVQFAFPRRVETTVWALRRVNKTWYVDLPASLRLDPYQQAQAKP